MYAIKNSIKPQIFILENSIVYRERATGTINVIQQYSVSKRAKCITTRQQLHRKDSTCIMLDRRIACAGETI